MVFRICPRKVVCDVREKSCSSRKETTNETVVKIKAPVNVTIVYWHYVQFTKQIEKLCYLAAFKQEVSRLTVIAAR